MVEISFLPLACSLILSFILAVSIWWFVVGLQYFLKNRKFVYVRGANGSEGRKINMICPTGTKIDVNEAVLICSDVDSGGIQPKCDPFNDDGTFNKRNTQNIKRNLSRDCDGFEKCTFTVPSLDSDDCGNCKRSQLISTYYCR